MTCNRLAGLLILVALASGPATAAIAVAAGNYAPQISGQPATSINAGSLYSFVPTASDPNGDRLLFSIQRKPGWASFDVATGRLYGNPAATAVGNYLSVRISVSDGRIRRYLSSFSIRVNPAPTPAVTPNKAPTISGNATTAIKVGDAYAFRPTAADPEGRTLGFSIANKPVWTSFSTSTGQLSGTPAAADVGTYANIVISASDGALSSSLAPFSVAVSTISTGAVTLSWTPPTRNTDGSVLTDLGGYRIHYGASATALDALAEIRNPGISSATIDNLTTGTYYYFAMTAYDTGGLESSPTKPVSKLVR